MSPLLLRHLVLPNLFVTVALLGGLRFVGAANELRFVPPPLMALFLAALLFVLFARSGLVDVARDWLGEARTPLENASGALTLLALFCASAQVFNAVLPEDTLFSAFFTLLFLLVFWTSLFSVTRPQRFVTSLAGLLAASFLVKYGLLAAISAESESLAGTLARALLRGVSLGTLESARYGAATGYTAFATTALYLVGLWAASPPRDEGRERLFELLAETRRLSAVEERRILAALAPGEPDAIDAEIEGEGSSK